jgi:hypothetical protein
MDHPWFVCRIPGDDNDSNGEKQVPCQSFRPAICLRFSGFFLPIGVAENWRRTYWGRQPHDLGANISTVFIGGWAALMDSPNSCIF